MDGDTTTIMEITRNGCNGIASTAGQTGLVFLEMLITKTVIISVAAKISNGANIAATTQENTYGILITDQCDPLLVTDKNEFGTEIVLGFNNTLEVYNILIALKVLIQHSKKQFEGYHSNYFGGMQCSNYFGGIQYSNYSGGMQYSRKYLKGK